MLKNLKLAIREKFLEYQFAAEAMGMNKGNLSKLYNTDPEKVDSMRPSTISKIEKAFPEYNIEWLLDRSDIKYKEDLTNSYKKPKLDSVGFSINNINSLGNLPDDEISMFDEDGNTKFYEISPGVYRMKVPLIPETAKAGYFTGFADAEYIEDQDYIVTTVYKYHKGKYKAFRVVGDSMDIDRRVTFVHGDVIIGREIMPDLWRSPFHTHKYPFYIFVTKTDGIIFKELVSHDVEKGIVKLHSLNEDKSNYPDFELNLEDVGLIFNVVKRESEI